jgi:hypothetical protein
LWPEGKGLIEIRTRLLDRYFATPPEDRFSLKRDLDDLDRELRQLSVYQEALKYLPAGTGQGPTETLSPAKEPEEISLAWLDRFNEYARTQNESWRADLLARALAKEADHPGSIGPRALWFIGTIEESVFHAFAAVIDTAIKVGPNFLIPEHESHNHDPISTCALNPNLHLGQILFLLNDLGVVSPGATTLSAGSSFDASYGSIQYRLHPNADLTVRALATTSFGNIVASLYEPKRTNSVGEKIFAAWIERLRQLGFGIRDV